MSTDFDAPVPRKKTWSVERPASPFEMHPYNVGFISNALGFKLIGVIFSEM
jgi:hypothetical protein